MATQSGTLGGVEWSETESRTALYEFSRDMELPGIKSRSTKTQIVAALVKASQAEAKLKTVKKAKPDKQPVAPSSAKEKPAPKREAPAVVAVAPPAPPAPPAPAPQPALKPVPRRKSRKKPTVTAPTPVARPLRRRGVRIIKTR